VADIDPKLDMWRSLSVLWSFLWRTWGFMIPFVMVFFALAFSMIPRHGEKPLAPGLLFSAFPLVLFPLSVFIQVFAMKLALKAQLPILQAIRRS
jgi:hypothetical protein